MPPAAAAGEPIDRREEILAAAQAVLAETGYAGASMLAIARRAKASKETLYDWFGDKRGLFEALVLSNAREVEAAIALAMTDAAPEPASVLTAFAEALLRLLFGERSLVVNRAAIAEASRDATLARLLASGGRETILPRLLAYLETQRAEGHLRFEDAAEAADVLVGLVLSDWQVRRLLGVLPPPDETALARRAARAAGHFLTLFGVPR